MADEVGAATRECRRNRNRSDDKRKKQCLKYRMCDLSCLDAAPGIFGEPSNIEALVSSAVSEGEGVPPNLRAEGLDLLIDQSLLLAQTTSLRRTARLAASEPRRIGSRMALPRRFASSWCRGGADYALCDPQRRCSRRSSCGRNLGKPVETWVNPWITWFTTLLSASQAARLGASGRLLHRSIANHHGAISRLERITEEQVVLGRLGRSGGIPEHRPRRRFRHWPDP